VAGIVFLVVIFLTPITRQALESITPEPVRIAHLVVTDQNAAARAGRRGAAGLRGAGAGRNEGPR